RGRDCRLVSLLDIMQEFDPSWFRSVSSAFGSLSFTCAVGADKHAVSDEIRSSGRPVFSVLSDFCGAMGLNASRATTEKILAALANEKSTYGELEGLSKQLDGRLTDELRNAMFLALNLLEAREYKSPRDGWEEIIERFPGIVRDVEDAVR